MENQENIKATEKSPEEQLKIARKLANTYGNEMRLYGMSLEWTSPRTRPDTTPQLRSNPEFQELPKDFRDEILNYGHKMKVFGLGCYQENTAAARFYDECHGQPPKNPFLDREVSQIKPQTPSQFGE